MSEAKHTPGPWHLHHQRMDFMAGDCDWSLQTDQAGAFLLFCHHPDAPAIANGRLIAAAPDMLAALKASEEFYNDNAAAMRRAAIAKATGETK